MNRTTWLQDRRMEKFTNVFSRWRGKRLSGSEAARAFPDDIVAEATSIYTGEKYAIGRFEAYPATRLTTGHVEAMPH